MLSQLESAISMKKMITVAILEHSNYIFVALIKSKRMNEHPFEEINLHWNATIHESWSALALMQFQQASKSIFGRLRSFSPFQLKIIEILMLPQSELDAYVCWNFRSCFNNQQKTLLCIAINFILSKSWNRGSAGNNKQQQTSPIITTRRRSKVCCSESA